MTRALGWPAVVLVVATTSCVPASEAAKPAGAIGFALEPSPATRGEAFDTDDRWHVRVEKVAFQLSVNGRAVDPGLGRRTYGTDGQYRFDAAKPTLAYARAVSVGPAASTLDLRGVYLERSETVDDPNLEISGLSPRDNARFRVAAEVGGDISGYFSYQGPALLLAVRGEKDGRVVTFDLTFALYDSASLTSPTLDVTADALVTSAATVAIEALFTDKVGSVHFGTFVDADVDHDGVITGAEMLAPGDCTTGCSSLDEHSLLETILSRVAGIFVWR